jgi:DNA adenine methylase Dam
VCFYRKVILQDNSQSVEKIMTIQSAIYLCGNKRKLWSDIKPHLEGKKILIDLFTGSGTVAINSVNEVMFEKVIANDSLTFLYDLHEALQSKFFLDMVKLSNEKYGDSKEEYLRLRKDYNSSGRLDLLLNLNYRSNSNMMRWNSKGGFNMPYGERLRYDSGRLKKHHELCKSIEFHNEDFRQLIENLENSLDFKDCVVYIDPPYQGTTAPYNEMGKWTEEQDNTLLDTVTYLHNAGAKVVMSNVFENRGHKNNWLIDWCDENSGDFEVHHLNMDYSNSSFRKSNHKTDEVLIVSRS